MAPRRLSPVLLLLLLFVAALHVRQTAAGFVLTSLPVEKVPVVKQLNASQAFTRVWQIKINASENFATISDIDASLPCQTFITYEAPSSSTPGDVLGEVRVSGSTAFIAQAVRVTSVTSDLYYAGPQVVLKTSNRSATEEFLFVEVVVFAKNKLKILKSQYFEDVVVLEDVLYTRVADELQTAVTTTTSISSSSDRSAKFELSLEEDKQIASPDPTKSSTRSWAIKWPSSEKPNGTQKVDLTLSLPGTASISRRDRIIGSDVQAGEIWINEVNSPSSVLDKVELEMSAASANASQEIQVRVKVNETGTTYERLNFNAWFYLPIQVKINQDDTVAVTTDGNSMSDRVEITAGGRGNIFVSDKNLLVNSMYATFSTESYGSIQVEVKDMEVSDGVAFKVLSPGSITYIGAHNSSLRASLRSNGSLCFPSSNASVMVTPSKLSDQVASLGQQSAKVSCVVKAVPARRMTRLEPNKRPTDGSEVTSYVPDEDDSSDSSGLSAATIVSIVVATVAGLAVLAFVLIKAGCLERCKTKRDEIAVPVGDFSPK